MTSALLLVGSPKAAPSTSGSMGKYLLRQLKRKGIQALTRPIGRVSAVNEALLEAIGHADWVILATPLYVDSLPYPVIHALQAISVHLKTLTHRKPQRFMCLLNCGFPESHQNRIAIDICRKFAQETGLEWVGGLALGGGEAVGGNSLESLGFMTRNIRKSLDIASEDLISGNPLSQEAIQRMAKPLMPAWIYQAIANVRFRQKANKNQVYKDFWACPYQ